MSVVRPLIYSKDQPKSRIELHVHLESSVRLNTLVDLIAKKNCPVQERCSYFQLFELLQINSPTTCQDVMNRINAYAHLINGDLNVIERIAYELCEDQFNQNVCYFEVRYAPQSMCNSNKVSPDPNSIPMDSTDTVTPAMVVEAVNKGLKRGQLDFDIKACSILCCVRNQPESGWEVLELCSKYQDDGVVGIDLCGDEFNGDPLYVFREVFQEAKRREIHRTCHVSESGPEEIRIAIDILNAERIGHGYQVVNDYELYQQCLKQQIHFECCPLAFYFVNSLKDSKDKNNHPLMIFGKDRANFSISRDNPTLLQNSLDDEYEYLRKLGLNETFVVNANLNAARSCFLEKHEKEKLLQHLYKVYGFN